MRVCAICRLEKDLSSYGYKSRKRGTFSSYCRECNRGYQRKHYKENRADYRDKHNKRRVRVMGEYRLLIKEYLDKHPCVDCGEKDHLVLEFDHIRGQKRAEVSTLVHDTLSWEKISEEISKCEVRCANCHKRRTAKQLGWWKSL